MKRNLEESDVVITGASSGIGKCTAHEFARHGARLVLASRSEKGLEDTAIECRAEGSETIVVPTDVTEETAVQQLAEKAIDHFGHIDTWVNNAGVIVYGKVEETPSDAYRRVIETNLFGCINGAHAVIPHFKTRGEGVLINVASMVGKVGYPYLSAYSASKFGVVGFSESLRMELVDMPGVKVCTIMPAVIDTPLYQHAANYTGRELKVMKPVYPAEKVAAAIVHCARHPHRELVVGNAGRQMIMLRNASRPLAEKVINRTVEHQQFAEHYCEEGVGNIFEPSEEIHSVSGGWGNNGYEEPHRGLSRGTMMGIAAGALTVAGLMMLRHHHQAARV